LKSGREILVAALLRGSSELGPELSKEYDLLINISSTISKNVDEFCMNMRLVSKTGSRWSSHSNSDPVASFPRM
jgi:hypothetical protein